MRRLVAVGVATGLGVSAAADGQSVAVQWPVADGGNGHWYLGIRPPSVISWTAARQAAESAGGHLATATSGPECDFLHAMAGNSILWLGRIGPWLGGYQDPGAADYSEPGGGWKWITGEPWFSRWGPNEPNNAGGNEGLLHFISLSCSNPVPGRHWNDIHAGPGGGCEPISPSYLVEWSADCDGNGIVDYGEILDGSLADSDANGVPDCCDAGTSCDPCPGDLDDTDTVDAEDLAAVLFAWGTDGGKTPQADITGDGTVDASDLAVVLGSWGACP